MKIFHVVLGTNENLELDCQGIPLSNTTQTYGSTLTSAVSMEYETIKGICQAFLLSYELGPPPPLLAIIGEHIPAEQRVERQREREWGARLS